MKILIPNSAVLNISLLVITAIFVPSGPIAGQEIDSIDEEYIAADEEFVQLADEEPEEQQVMAATIAENEPSNLPTRAPHAGVSANLFSSHSWYTPPPPPPARARPVQVRREPTAPPLPFSYIGRYEQEGTATLFFLVKGDRVFDVRIGDTIEGTYRFDTVANGQMMFTYLPLNSSQGLRLGETE